MNVLHGNIKRIVNDGNLILVDAGICDGNTLRAVIIGDIQTVKYLQLNNDIKLLFNESEVIVGKNLKGRLSISNRIGCVVNNVEHGKVFTRIQFEIAGQQFFGLIPTESYDEMDISVSETVEILIKVNDIFLKQRN